MIDGSIRLDHIQKLKVKTILDVGLVPITVVRTVDNHNNVGVTSEKQCPTHSFRVYGRIDKASESAKDGEPDFDYIGTTNFRTIKDDRWIIFRNGEQIKFRVTDITEYGEVRLYREC